MMMKSKQISTIFWAKFRDPNTFSGTVSKEIFDIFRSWPNETADEWNFLVVFTFLNIKFVGGENILNKSINLHFSVIPKQLFSRVIDLFLSVSFSEAFSNCHL